MNIHARNNKIGLSDDDRDDPVQIKRKRHESDRNDIPGRVSLRDDGQTQTS